MKQVCKTCKRMEEASKANKKHIYFQNYTFINENGSLYTTPLAPPYNHHHHKFLEYVTIYLDLTKKEESAYGTENSPGIKLREGSIIIHHHHEN